MKRFAPAVVFVAVLSLAAAPAIDTEALLRDGNAAFRSGDYAAAAELYERAGLRTTEPALVAFNFAAAKYRRALSSADGRAKHLDEAEQYFRCCLDPDDPRRPRALHFLGACLLQQALDGDVGRAKEAVTQLEECLRQPGLDEASADDVRHNLALARLLSAQTPPPPPETARSPDRPPEGDTQTKPRPRERHQPVDTGMNPGGDQKAGKTDQRMKGDEKADMNRKGNESHDMKSGSDHVHRGPDGKAIDPADVRHLQEAFERILAEQQKDRSGRAKANPPARGVKNW